MSQLVLTYGWHVEDNWYGQNYRLVLSVAEGEGFVNKAAANKYRTALKKYLKENHRQKVLNRDMEVGELESFKTYMYCANGPSYDCKNIHITINDL